MEKTLEAIKHVLFLVGAVAVGICISEHIKQGEMIKECEKAGKPCIISAIPMVTGL